MIINEYTVFSISGDNFDDSLFKHETKIPITVNARKGEKNQIGRYKEKISDTTIINIGNNDIYYSLDQMLELILPHISFAKSIGATEFTINLYIEYESQCNFYLTNSQLKKLSELEIDFMISCYEKQT